MFGIGPILLKHVGSFMYSYYTLMVSTPNVQGHTVIINFYIVSWHAE